MLLRFILSLVLLLALGSLAVSGFIVLHQAPIMYQQYRYTVPFGFTGGIGGAYAGGPMLVYSGDVDWNT